MSIEDLSAFFTRLQADEALREQAFALQDADAAERMDGLCRLAQEHGFDVSPEDWKHEAAGPAVAALEDDSLREVVGGACEFDSAGAYGAEGSLGWGASGCGNSVGAGGGPCEGSVGAPAGPCGQ